MTALYLVGLTFAVSVFGMVQLQHDTDRAEIERLTPGNLPAPARDLTGEWPVRQSPTDLAAVYTLPPMYLSKPCGGMQWLTTGYRAQRQYIPWPEIRDRLRRERAVLTPTEAFDAIVEIEWRPADWCDSCRVGRDGERHHQSCPGCPCPCSLVEVLT